MAETDLRKPIIKQLRECNALVFCIVGHVRQQPGIPDVYISHTYWSGWLEFKNFDTKLTDIQRNTIKELNKRQPGSAYIVRFVNGLNGINGLMNIEDHTGKVYRTLEGADGGHGLLNALSRLSRSQV